MTEETRCRTCNAATPPSHLFYLVWSGSYPSRNHHFVDLPTAESRNLAQENPQETIREGHCDNCIDKNPKRLCMTCNRQPAHFKHGRARYCKNCLAHALYPAKRTELDTIKRPRNREVDYRSSNAPGGAWKHSER